MTSKHDIQSDEHDQSSPNEADRLKAEQSLQADKTPRIDWGASMMSGSSVHEKESGPLSDQSAVSSPDEQIAPQSVDQKAMQTKEDIEQGIVKSIDEPVESSDLEQHDELPSQSEPVVEVSQEGEKTQSDTLEETAFEENSEPASRLAEEEVLNDNASQEESSTSALDDKNIDSAGGLMGPNEPGLSVEEDELAEQDTSLEVVGLVQEQSNDADAFQHEVSEEIIDSAIQLEDADASQVGSAAKPMQPEDDQDKSTFGEGMVEDNQGEQSVEGGRKVRRPDVLRDLYAEEDLVQSARQLGPTDQGEQVTAAGANVITRELSPPKGGSIAEEFSPADNARLSVLAKTKILAPLGINYADSVRVEALNAGEKTVKNTRKKPLKNRIIQWGVLFQKWRLQQAAQRRSWLKQALIFSGIVHGLILSIHFNAFGVKTLLQDTRGLDVVLVNTQSAERPEDPQAIAQVNLSGGGLSEQDQIMQSPSMSNQVISVEDFLLQEAQKKLATLEEKQQKLLSQLVDGRFINRENEADGEEAKTDKQDELEETLLKQSSLPSELAENLITYNKRPRRQFSAPNVASDPTAIYRDSWRTKVQEIGTVHYPKYGGEKLYGTLILSVTVKADGYIRQIEVDQSSGNPFLDKAAIRIARMGEPYGVFSPEIRSRYDEIVITRRWNFTNDILRANKLGE